MRSELVQGQNLIIQLCNTCSYYTLLLFQEVNVQLVNSSVLRASIVDNVDGAIEP